VKIEFWSSAMPSTKLYERYVEGVPRADEYVWINGVVYVVKCVNWRFADGQETVVQAFVVECST
jgi:hypothetical protein